MSLSYNNIYIVININLITVTAVYFNILFSIYLYKLVNFLLLSLLIVLGLLYF